MYVFYSKKYLIFNSKSKYFYSYCLEFLFIKKYYQISTLINNYLSIKSQYMWIFVSTCVVYFTQGNNSHLLFKPSLFKFSTGLYIRISYTVLNTSKLFSQCRNQNKRTRLHSINYSADHLSFLNRVTCRLTAAMSR